MVATKLKEGSLGSSFDFLGLKQVLISLDLARVLLPSVVGVGFLPKVVGMLVVLLGIEDISLPREVARGKQGSKVGVVRITPV